MVVKTAINVIKEKYVNLQFYFLAVDIDVA